MTDSNENTILNNLREDMVPQFKPTFRLQWEEAQKCYVVLYPEGMVKLNDSAGEILKRCDGKATLGQIVNELSQHFSCEKDFMFQECSKFLTHAMQRGWIGV